MKLMKEKGLLAPSPASYCATKFQRKMRGGSQSSLIQAENGNYYIVKFLGNPQGSGVLLHEVLGSEIMRSIGFETPHWSPIWFSAKFIEENPGLWFETANSGRQRPSVGLHFGSKLILPTSNEGLFEILPRSWFARIRQRENFVGMLLFDMWANNQDNRQAIFVQNLENRSIRATFIDHGFLFGRGGASKSGRIRAMYLDPAIYENIDLDVVLREWEDRIATLSETTLTSLINHLSIPSQWYTSLNITRIVSRLAERRALLGKYADLIRATMASRIVDKLTEASNERSGKIQICSAQLRTYGFRRISRTVSRVG